MNNNSSVEFLFLSEPDIISAGALDMEQCISTIEETFRLVGEGDYVMGGPDGTDHGLQIHFPANPRFAGMPSDGPDRRFMSLVSYLGGDFHICGEKWYGSNVANRDKGLPRSILTVMLNDPDTGAPLSLLSGNLISAMRTGAVPGVATKYLAPPHATTVGTIGGGVINQTCLRAIVTQCPTLERVLLYDIDITKGRAIAAKLSTELGLAVEAVAGMEDAVTGADIVTVAASGVHQPEIDHRWIKPGALIALTGNAKFTGNFYRSTRIVADLWAMHRNWILEDRHNASSQVDPAEDTLKAQGLETLHPNLHTADNVIDFGEVVTGRTQGRLSDDAPIIMLSGGLPMEDAAWATQVYRNAKSRGIGQNLSLWDTPALA